MDKAISHPYQPFAVQLFCHFIVIKLDIESLVQIDEIARISGEPKISNFMLPQQVSPTTEFKYDTQVPRQD
jgi:undecaprenyl pyrophosphate synthase